MQINEYEVLHQIGRGGMGQVLLVRRVYEDGKIKILVMKIPNAAAIVDPAKLKMFHYEAELSMKLNEPNIVSVFDKGVWQGLPYIVMEYFSGKNGAELISRMVAQGEPMPWKVALWISLQVGYGLVAAHGYVEGGVRMGIIHRDVSLRNVLVSGRGAVKITDFGMAKLVSKESTACMIKGSVSGMSPEQARGKDADELSDGFSLGALMWSLLSLREFRSEIPADKTHGAALDGLVPRLARTDLDARVLEVVYGLLEPDREKRMSIPRAVALLEGFVPISKTAVGTLVTGLFRGEVNRSGSTQVDIEIITPETIASIEMAKTAKRLQETARDNGATAPERGPPSPSTAEIEMGAARLRSTGASVNMSKSALRCD